MFALPSRPQPDMKGVEAKALAAEVTRALALTPNPYPGPLYPHQAVALKELYEQRGLIGLLSVGSGKTLLSALAFTVLGAQRPLLLLPASMLVDCRKTWALLAAHWRIPALDSVKLLSFEKLSTPSSGAKLLPDGSVVYPDIVARYNPDVVVADEAHRLGSTSAAGTRRLGRFLAGRPDVVFVGLSGTLIRTSFRSAAHSMEWALHQQSPLPCAFEPLEQLADCTDARTASPGARTEPGVLLAHLAPSEASEYDSADSPEDGRAVITRMIGRRMLETAGVIGSSGDPLAIPARLDPAYPAAPDPAIDRELLLLMKGDGTREAWSTPDGTLIPDAVGLARHLATVSLGFYLQQDPAPPVEYREAASNWAKAVRNTVKYRADLAVDSEYQVRDAVRRGILPELEETLAAWETARSHYTATTGLREPPSVPTWISSEAIESVRRWLTAGPGYVWVGYIALGRRLSADLGLAYFAGGKRDATGRHVTDLQPGESAILSHSSCGTGTDGLQSKGISRQLWLVAPNEQSLGRLHRPGFDGECVGNDIYLPGKAQLSRFWRNVDVAKNFTGQIVGAQKLTLFESTVPREAPDGGARWGKLSGVSFDDVGEDS